MNKETRPAQPERPLKTTAQVLIDCLEAEGVDVMFGIPGEETLDLMFAQTCRKGQARRDPHRPAPEHRQNAC